jgi:Rieske Fe-S protein
MADDLETAACTLTRRSFCLHACEAASLVALGALIEECSSSPTSPSGNVPALPTVTGTVSNGIVTVALDTAPALASVGSAALVQAGPSSYLVARPAQDSFIALTAVCTHEGCTVTGFQNARYVCPCHGSQYTTSGAVVMGPATQALRQFSTQFANNLLTFSAS